MLARDISASYFPTWKEEVHIEGIQVTENESKSTASLESPYRPESSMVVSQSSRIMGKALTFHIADPGSILSASYGPQNPSGMPLTPPKKSYVVHFGNTVPEGQLEVLWEVILWMMTDR